MDGNIKEDLKDRKGNTVKSQSWLSTSRCEQFTLL